MRDAVKARFEALFERHDDPWGFRTRWYEARKRDLTLACLPAPRYHRAYEPGCANGELSAALAPRCDSLLASDGVDGAVALARQRLKDMAQVQVFQAWIPDDWPEGALDLVVLSELGFYLDARQLDRLIARVRQSAGTKGTVLACHWRHEIQGFALDGDTVHQHLHAQLGMTRLLHHEEADLVLDVWSADGRSVAQREALV